MNELVLDLQAELMKISAIDAESIGCPSYKVQGFFT